MPLEMAAISFAPMRAKAHGGVPVEWTTKRENAYCAEGILLSTNIQAQNAVQSAVQPITGIKVMRIRRLPPEPVYNMEVERFHNFAVNGGLIVHNCVDAVRYALSPVWRRRGD